MDKDKRGAETWKSIEMEIDVHAGVSGGAEKR